MPVATAPIPRADWKPTLELGPPMPAPAWEVWLHHSVTIATSNLDALAHGDAFADMRAIERIGDERFGRFPYSYCYHPPDRIWLEGAGFTIGAHTKGHNSRGLGLAVIGNTSVDAIPHFAEDAAGLVLWLLEQGQLRTRHVYPTGGHRDVKSTECPGNRAYAAIPEIRRLVAAGPASPILNPDDPNWSDMATKDEIKQAFREVLAEPTRAGTPAGSITNMLRGTHRAIVEAPEPRDGDPLNGLQKIRAQGRQTKARLDELLERLARE